MQKNDVVLILYRKILADQSESFLRELKQLTETSDILCIAFRRAVWTSRARAPKEFRRHLEDVLRFVKSRMKIEYGIPSHRLAQNSDRDRDLFNERTRRPELSWRELGRLFQMNRGAAEAAYKRQIGRRIAPAFHFYI